VSPDGVALFPLAALFRREVGAGDAVDLSDGVPAGEERRKLLASQFDKGSVETADEGAGP
jgi:hypothetical protein